MALSPKIAVVCDWLVTYAGAERVLEQILHCFPQADLFAVVDFLEEKDRHILLNKSCKTTFIQKLPFAKKNYRHYLPLMPLAIEQLDLSHYDVIISSSHAVAKGVIIGPHQLHISYVHTPMRYAWDLQFQYLHEAKLDKGVKSWLVRYMLHCLRLWDVNTANRVDYFIANSNFVAKRIEKIYRRQAAVIYPPVDIEAFSLIEQKEDFYLTVSRLVPYKKIDLIVEAFAGMPDKKLVVIGDGPDWTKVKSKARSNVQLMGYQSFEALKNYLQTAKAFIFAAEEDFGIAPVEAQACGTPAIAYGKGGALETIKGVDQQDPTGMFFLEQTPDSIIFAVKKFDEIRICIDPKNCRENAIRFSREKFRETFTEFVMSKLELKLTTDYQHNDSITQTCI